MKSTKLPETGYLRINQILGDDKDGLLPIIPVKKTTWWNGVKSGLFPKSYKILGSTVWRVEDIRKLLKEIDSGEHEEKVKQHKMAEEKSKSSNEKNNDQSGKVSLFVFNMN